jgi:hypothetical protein
MQKLVYFLLAFLLNTNVLAEFSHTFIGYQQGCAKVNDTSCSIPAPLISKQLIGGES